MIPNIKISSLTIGYATKVVIENINLSSDTHKLIALIGRNGKGKSTLLKTLSGLLEPLKGQVFFNDKNISTVTDIERAKLLSIVLSNNGVIENILVRDYIAYGRYPYTNWLGINTLKDHKRIDNAIELCDIKELSNRYYSQLSDGERQKVNIARAITQDTPFVILDEPTAHLDLINKVEILKLLKELSENHHKTIIISTHQIEMALQLCDEIWTLSNDKLEVNTPLQLIDSNKLDRLFGNEHVKFNPATKNFVIK